MSITVKLPDDLAGLLAEEAARQSLTPDELAARVLAEHIPARRHLGFVLSGSPTLVAPLPKPSRCWPKDSAADAAG